MTNSSTMKNTPTLNRRAFIEGGTLVLASLATSSASASPSASTPGSNAGLRFGLITDLHYADKDTVGTRFYRDTLGKLEEASAQFAKNKVEFIVELGDLIDAADSVQVELGYLKTINKTFAAICKDRHYVLGNHCVDTLTKQEFLDAVEQPKSFHSFDRGGFHFVALDCCYRSDHQPYQRKNFVWTDSNIPPEELEWLKSDLKEAAKPTIVFTHQRLDVSNDHGVKNCVEVRKILEDSGNVMAVFQGHSHKNDLNQIEGIHYCTLQAMVEGAGPESSGYSTIEINDQQTIRVAGFRKQANHNLERQGRA